MEILDSINNFLWTYVVILLLVICAVYFTFKGRFLQFRLLPDMVGVLFNRSPKYATSRAENMSYASESDDEQVEPANPNVKHIGSFKAFSVALSSRVGTGNLAGVASAIFIGGPGAVFWMWIMALLGSATAFVESTLAQLYKKRGEHSYFGGPAYYMQMGLHSRWMGVLFAVLITITFGMANQMVQSTTICDSVSDAFIISKHTVGIFLTIATFLVIFGGIRRISHFASLLVPFMAVGFLLLAAFVIITHIGDLPRVFRVIFEGAFGFQSVAGGAFGTAVMQGVKRGLFSNEAGEGSAPNAAAIAETSHPVKQGLLQSLGVFADTLVICTCTAFIVIISGKYTDGADGIILTTQALESEIGSLGRYFITAAILLFAYTTIIANYFYGETNIRFIMEGHSKPLAETGKRGHKTSWAVSAFRIITGGAIMIGALIDLQTAFSLVDIVMGLMTITNLVAILRLSPQAFRLLDNYEKQKKEGRNPTFNRAMMPDIESDIECWEGLQHE